jgi:hypothetical protein
MVLIESDGDRASRNVNTLLDIVSKHFTLLHATIAPGPSSLLFQELKRKNDWRKKPTIERFARHIVSRVNTNSGSVATYNT